MSERFAVPIVLCVVLLAGCAGRYAVSGPGDRSSSADRAAEIALAQAVGAMGLPDGGGARLRLDVTGPENVRDTALRIMEGALAGRDYRVVDGAPAVMTVRVDSCAVTTENAGLTGMVEHRASARLSAVLVAADGARRTFYGAGVVHVTFPERNADFPGPMNRRMNRESRAGLHAVKSVIIAVALTVMAWALYSYRG